MCLAVYKPALLKPDWDALEEGFSSNSDGAGFIVSSGGNLICRKGFMTFDALRAAFMPFEYEQAAIHFRWATHGKKNKDNCHPFRVTEGLAMVHNGILPIECNINPDKSDTWHYVNLILAPMAERDADFFTRPEVKFMGEAAIGGNKFIFLRADGEYSIWNEDSGHWNGEIWYSNTSYKRYKYVGLASSYYSDKEKKPKPKDRWPALEELGEESRYRDMLPADQRWAYDDMLLEGFTVSELDDMVANHGGDCLLEFLENQTVTTEVSAE